MINNSNDAVTKTERNVAENAMMQRTLMKDKKSFKLLVHIFQNLRYYFSNRQRT